MSAHCYITKDSARNCKEKQNGTNIKPRSGFRHCGEHGLVLHVCGLSGCAVVKSRRHITVKEQSDQQQAGAVLRLAWAGRARRAHPGAALAADGLGRPAAGGRAGPAGAGPGAVALGTLLTTRWRRAPRWTPPPSRREAEGRWRRRKSSLAGGGCRRPSGRHPGQAQGVSRPHSRTMVHLTDAAPPSCATKAGHGTPMKTVWA